MSIVIIAPTRDCSVWITQLKALDKTLEIETYPHVSDPDKVSCAVVWLYPHGVLNKYPNLRLICSMGAGVDHILKDPGLPDVPVTRIVSERLAFSMNTYVASAVLNIHRNYEKYRQDQRSKTWDQKTFPEVEVITGIYGFGYLGRKIGITLRDLGLEVHGYSKSRKKVEGIATYGEEEESLFLSKINVLVGVLPMTSETNGIFNYALFRKLRKPTCFINVGRGNQQVEKDIIKALDEGLLSGAVLDVFEHEPLPKDSPLWEHPKVKLTPHIAGITNPDAAVPQIFENYRAMTKGKELINEVNKQKGY
ncbi:MAG: glyoxylate/hydroxypyruvate reductase A [Cyclobacteriaceae bacterium]